MIQNFGPFGRKKEKVGKVPNGMPQVAVALGNRKRILGRREEKGGAASRKQRC